MICRLRKFLLLSVGAVSAAVSGAEYVGVDAPQAHQLDESYTFEQYLDHFDKSYDDQAEYDTRSQIFVRNIKKIMSHNEGKMTEDGDVIEGYVMGVNMFTDVDAGELPMGYNKLMHPAWRTQLMAGASKTERMLGGTDTDAYSRPPDFQMDEVSDLPTEVDWEKEGKMNPTIPQQGGCGSCWSFATTGIIESHLAIATGEDTVVSLSEQSILQCTPNPDHCGGDGGCKGSTVELAMNYLADITAQKTGGMYNIDEVPYDANKGDWGKCEDLATGKTPSVGINGWTQLPANDYKATMNALAKAGPLAIAAAASGWAMYEKGVYEGTGDATVNHAIIMVGYGVDETTGEKYYKVRNSWGPGFGEDGYIRIKRTDDDSNVCHTDTNPLVGLACALDDNGNKIDVQPVEVCGTNGVLLDVSYPVDVHKIE